MLFNFISVLQRLYFTTICTVHKTNKLFTGLRGENALFAKISVPGVSLHRNKGNINDGKLPHEWYDVTFSPMTTLPHSFATLIKG